MKLFAQLPSLNQPQRLQVLAVLHPAAGLDRVIGLIAEIRAPRRRCPDCACERFYRHGQANDLQRFRCCQCGRTIRAPRKTVASGSSFGREAEPYGRTVSIAGRKCNAQQVYRGALQ